MQNHLHWPRFLRRKKEDGSFEERKFNRPEEVPDGEGWELITPPAPNAAATTSAAAAEVARLAQRLAEVSRKSADQAGEILELEQRLGQQANFLQKMHAYVDELEKFATDIGSLPDAPSDVAKRIEDILAASPRRAMEPDDPSPPAGDAAGKGKGGKGGKAGK